MNSALLLSAETLSSTKQNSKRGNDGIKRSSLPNRDLGTFHIRPANDLLNVNRARASRFLFPHVARKGGDSSQGTFFDIPIVIKSIRGKKTCNSRRSFIDGQGGIILMELNQKDKLLNKDIIKYMAMFTMLLNHIANIFLPNGILYEICLNLGYFTAVIMCYFLVEGYQYTHSKKRYLQRLLLFTLISQIPYSLAFTTEAYIEFHGFSMMATLTLCFFILLTVEKVKSRLSKAIVILLLILLSSFCDWSLLAPIFTLLFIWAQNSTARLKAAFFISALLFGLFNFTGGIGTFSLGANLFYSVSAMAGVGLGGLCILYLYNGKRMQRGQNFSKWFFYFFYPVHLLILGIIRIAAGL